MLYLALDKATCDWTGYRCDKNLRVFLLGMAGENSWLGGRWIQFLGKAGNQYIWWAESGEGENWGTRWLQLSEQTFCAPPGVHKWLTATVFLFSFFLNSKCRILRRRRNWWMSWWNREMCSRLCSMKSVMTICLAKVSSFYEFEDFNLLINCHDPVFDRASNTCVCGLDLSQYIIALYYFVNLTILKLHKLKFKMIYFQFCGQGDRRLSYKALQGALMIYFYRYVVFTTFLHLSLSNDTDDSVSGICLLHIHIVHFYTWELYFYCWLPGLVGERGF